MEKCGTEQCSGAWTLVARCNGTGFSQVPNPAFPQWPGGVVQACKFKADQTSRSTAVSGMRSLAGAFYGLDAIPARWTQPLQSPPNCDRRVLHLADLLQKARAPPMGGAHGPF